MKKLLIVFGVLLVHTAAAHAQQVAPSGPEALPPPPPPTPGAAPAPAPSAQEMPPAYAPPPGYLPPPPPAYPPRPVYGPGPVYGPPPPVYPPPVYRPYRYAPPPPYRYAPAPYYAPYVPPQRDVLNRPFTLGGGIGFGGLIFDDQFNANNMNVHRDGLSYTFRLGFGLRPGLLLLWDVEGTAANYGNSSVMQTANLVALQVFCTQRFFLKGGFGFAGASQDSLPTQWGGAAMGGIGYELVQGWNWSFDIEATVTGAHINNNGADQVWTNWSLVNFALNFF